MKFNTRICNDINRMFGMCDTCYKKIILPRVSKPNSLILNDLVDNSSCRVADATINMTFDFKCRHCGEHIALIDKGIFNQIFQLNQKGYFTESCCEGHITFENTVSLNISAAFVKFILDDDLCEDSIEDIRKKLIDDGLTYWKPEFGEYGNLIIRAVPEVSIFPKQEDCPSNNDFKREATKVFNRYKRAYLKELGEFVNRLETF